MQVKGGEVLENRNYKSTGGLRNNNAVYCGGTAKRLREKKHVHKYAEQSNTCTRMRIDRSGTGSPGEK